MFEKFVTEIFLPKPARREIKRPAGSPLLLNGVWKFCSAAHGFGRLPFVHRHGSKHSCGQDSHTNAKVSKAQVST